MERDLGTLAQHLWRDLADLDARWARVYAGMLATLRPGEYSTLGLRHPRFDLTAGPAPSVCAWVIDDDNVVLEVLSNGYLTGAMRLTGAQEAGLRRLGFEEPGSSSWWPKGEDCWRLVGGFMDVAALGVMLVEVGGIMGLVHPMLASLEDRGSTLDPDQEPCIHLLTCSRGLSH